MGKTWHAGTSEDSSLLEPAGKGRTGRSDRMKVAALCVGALVALAGLLVCCHQFEFQDTVRFKSNLRAVGTDTSEARQLPLSAPKTPNVDSEGNYSACHVLIVMSSNTTHLAQLANHVADGARSVVTSEDNVRVRTATSASFEDVLWADAILLGSHVNNANVDHHMVAFINSWDFHADLSHKVGAAFVTSGGLSAGQELTMVNLLHSMMIFRMVIVGGEKWTSAFGASAVVGEPPFAKTKDDSYFPMDCSPTDPSTINAMFSEKAYGLGKRASEIAQSLGRGWK